MVYLIDTVVNSCFTKDNDYKGYLYEFSLAQCILIGFTDIELPENVDDKYAYIYDNKLNEFDELFVHSECIRQIQFIKNQSLELVKYRKEKSLKHSKIDELMDELTSFIQKMSKQFEDIDLEDIKGFSKLGEQFGDIDQDKFMDKVIEMACKED